LPNTNRVQNNWQNRSPTYNSRHDALDKQQGRSFNSRSNIFLLLERSILAALLQRWLFIEAVRKVHKTHGLVEYGDVVNYTSYTAPYIFSVLKQQQSMACVMWAGFLCKRGKLPFAKEKNRAAWLESEWDFPLKGRTFPLTWHVPMFWWELSTLCYYAFTLQLKIFKKVSEVKKLWCNKSTKYLLILCASK
jgi:hypothetical protein